MIFSVTLNDLQRHIQKALPVIPSKATIPALEHLHFALTGNDLEIIGSDQDITLVTRMQVQGTEDGKILVPGKKISDILKSLGNIQSIEFIANPDTYEITVKVPRGKYTLKGLNPEEYLQLPVLFESKKPEIHGNSNGNIDAGLPTAKLTKDELTKLAEKTHFSVSTDDYRPAMTGVLFQFREKYVNAVSTDSFRLVRTTINSDTVSFPQDFDIIIPAKSIEILRKADDDTIMSVVENQGKITHARFDIGQTIFITRLIVEKFPPYESVIPLQNDNVAVLDKSELLSKIRSASLLTNSASKQVKLIFSDNNLTIYGFDEESGSNSTLEMECDYTGPQTEIGFNYKYIEDALNNVSDEDTDDNLVQITFSEPNRPALVKPKSEKDELLMLIMPVRI